MAEIIGLIASAVFLIVLLLPVLTFLRLGRLARELEDLSSRVTKLERQRVSAAVAAETPPVAPPHGVVETDPSPDAAASASWPSTPVAAPVTETQAAPLPPLAPGIATTAEAPPPASDDLEERIGGRGLLYAGVLVLFFGISFFLKYAFDNAWINETGRTTLGALGGIGFIALGLRLATGGLDTFGHALVGTGFAILYLVVYAALNFYGLIDATTAFALMVLVTLGGAIVADRQRSQALAFIAVAGGLLTPALVGSTEASQLTLFTYDALLVMGTVLLSLRHQWLALNALTYLGTIIIVAAWIDSYYTSREWLRTLLFLTLFCVCFLSILRATRGSRGPVAFAVRALLWTAPVLYHVAAIVIAAAHPPAIHIYLIAFTVVGLWWTVEPYRPVLRLVILIAVLVPMFGSLTLPDGRSWLVPNVVTIVTVAVLHLMALVDRVLRQEESLHGSDLVSLHAAGIGLFALLYNALQPVFPGFRGGLAATVALGAGALWRVFRHRDETAALNAIGLVLVLAALGIAVQFDGAVAVIGWAAEGAVAAWLGVSRRRTAFQVGGVLLWAFAAMRLFETFSNTPNDFTLLFNARALATFFVVATGYVIAARLAAIPQAEGARMRLAVHVIASVLTLGWLTAEIRSFWALRFESPQAHLYEQMLLSLAWGLYGAVLIVIGMVRRYAPLRYIGITVIIVTSFKVFFYDLWELGGIYRVVGFIGLGVLLVLVSYLYQRSRPRRAAAPAPEPAPTRGLDDADRSQL